MESIIKEILDYKGTIQKNNLKMDVGNKLYLNYKNLITGKLPNRITDKLNLSETDYKVWGSIGQGQYAQVPWVAITDKKITKTTQGGYYIVILFHPEGKGVYLTLNQGWKAIQSAAKGTDYNKEELAKSLANRLSELVHSDFEQGSFAYNTSRGIQLSDNAKGYAFGSVFFKYFDYHNIVNSDFVSDLSEIIIAYKNLVEKVSREYYMEMLNSLEDFTIKKEIESINSNKSVGKVSMPIFKRKPKKGTSSSRITDDNLKKIQKENNLTGAKGEDLAIKYFVDLIDNSSLDETKKMEFKNSIEHVSKKGHGDGYDLTAFDPENLEEVDKKYIEVKATTSANKEEPFYLSQNEVFAIKENPNKILIMRLYDIKNKPKVYFVDPYKNRNSFDSVEELLSSVFSVEAVNYKVIGLKDPNL